MFLAVSLEPLITKPRQPVFMGQNYRTDLAGIHGIHQRQKPLARKIHPSANLFDKLHVGKAACEAELFQRHPLGSSGPIVGFDYSPGNTPRFSDHVWLDLLVPESQTLIFGVIATACVGPTGRLESPCAIPPLDRLDVHPEQAGDFMAGKCAVHDLYSYPFRHR